MHPKIVLYDPFQLVMELRENGRAREAYEVLVQAVEFVGLAQLEASRNSMIWDGGFESDVTGQAYAWRFARTSRSAQIDFDTQGKNYRENPHARVYFLGGGPQSLL